MNKIDQVIEAVNSLSLLAQLNDMVVEARDTDRKECGNCLFWMMSHRCPREQNVNGWSQGPNCSAPACGLFEVKKYVVELKAKRVEAAIEFAVANNLPIPRSALTGRDHAQD